MIDHALGRAAEAIATADVLLIGAGAGLGVDSGLPDFRGKDGFWRAYPPYQRLGLDFAALANPRWFVEVVLELGGALVRINSREPDVPAGHVSLPMGALAALLVLDANVNALAG